MQHSRNLCRLPASRVPVDIRTTAKGAVVVCLRLVMRRLECANGDPAGKSDGRTTDHKSRNWVAELYVARKSRGVAVDLIIHAMWSAQAL